MKKILLLATLLTTFLSSCGPVVRHPVSLSHPSVKTAFVPDAEYRIGVGDQLDIKFFYQPELNEIVTVRPDGRISLQLIQEVRAAGLTAAELNDKLVTAYSSELKKPAITVIVRTFTDHRVYLDGEINKAGLVPMVGPMTVLQSISQAGGLKESAKTDEVIVARQGDDGKYFSMVVNLDKAVDGSDMNQDILLRPNDIVFVPRSHIADVNMWVDLYIRRNVPIPVTAGYGF